MKADLPARDDNARHKILNLFATKPRQRLTPAEIHRRGGFAANGLQSIIDALRDLCREGRLVRLKKNHYALPDSQNLVSGKIHAHPDGYGFLIPEDKSIEDLYINRREMRRVMHGDRVIVRVDQKPRGETEAHIAQILERGQKQLLGTYSEFGGKSYLVPMDPRLAGAIALNVAGIKPEPGKVIAAELSRYGTAMSPPQAEMIKVIGDAG